MNNLTKLAEVLRDIAEERDMREIELALDLCTGFGHRMGTQREEAAEYAEAWAQWIVARYFSLPN
jgi:hypothetical protein